MIVHFNGRLVPSHQASVSPFDRGFLFGDGVYEGLRAFDGHVVAMPGHVARMNEGLGAAGIDFDASALAAATPALLEANGLRDGFIYWQVTRGTPGPGRAVRTRLPDGPMTPTVFGYAVPAPDLAAASVPGAACLVSMPDPRWTRGRLKSISLMGNVLGVLHAQEHGAPDVLFTQRGLVAEASSTNVVLALPSPSGTRLVTPSLDSVSILAGVTRDVLLAIRPDIESRPVREAELALASEIILLGTLSMVLPVVELDGRRVGEGKPGLEARRLLTDYTDWIRREVSGARPAPVAHGAR